eukprot:7012986-Pyramimonas_sp.AAC.1
MGRLTACANPRARMFYSDLEALQSLGEGETLLTRRQGSFLALFWGKTFFGWVLRDRFHPASEKQQRAVAMPPPEHESPLDQ